jgi:Zn-dependent protease
MTPTRQGSLKIFRLFGIDVFLHWSWFLVALYEMQGRQKSYGSATWNALEYGALFGIVLMHEFGHALACRSVGGKADQIVLWPLGGVAYVSPPQRPGAMLWSIAAGPLVNVALAPLLTVVWWISHTANWAATMPNLSVFIDAVWAINLGLLIFNSLPLYPLDGGQILRSLLWYIFGRAQSLLIAASLGFVGVAGLVLLAIYIKSIWLGILSVFIVLNCWSGLMHARALLKLARLPRREECACPKCQAPPPLGKHWLCGNCQQPFDIFQAGGCPQCGAQYTVIGCFECGGASAADQWQACHPGPSVS